MSKNTKVSNKSAKSVKNNIAAECVLGEYNGNPTLTFPGGVIMGQRKIKAVLDNLEASRAFIESNGQSID